MATYQDVIAADNALAAWAFTEASGLDFAPYISAQHLTGRGTFLYRQAGPFAAAFGLHFNVGADASFTFGLQINPPFSVEAWVRVVANPPAASAVIHYSGNSASNGSGVYIASATSHLHLLLGGHADNDLGIIWPDTNWHLYQVAGAPDGSTETIGLDGVVRLRKPFSGAIAPSPDNMDFGGSNNQTAVTPIELAYPALYAYELSPAQMANHYLAATNPDAAIGNTLSGGAGLSGSNSDLLNKILAAVQKTLTHPGQ